MAQRRRGSLLIPVTPPGFECVGWPTLTQGSVPNLRSGAPPWAVSCHASGVETDLILGFSEAWPWLCLGLTPGC
jgi:hypothetical protein